LGRFCVEVVVDGWVSRRNASLAPLITFDYFDYSFDYSGSGSVHLIKIQTPTQLCL
jgi:hypothetical protein